jgi:hypothetical protein
MSLRHLHRPGAEVVNLTRLHSVYGIGAGRCRQPCPQWDKANGMKEEEKKNKRFTWREATNKALVL